MRTCLNYFFESFQMLQAKGGIPLHQGLKYVGFLPDRQGWNEKNTTSESNQRVLVYQERYYNGKTRTRHTTRF